MNERKEINVGGRMIAYQEPAGMFQYAGDGKIGFALYSIAKFEKLVQGKTSKDKKNIFRYLRKTAEGQYNVAMGYYTGFHFVHADSTTGEAVVCSITPEFFADDKPEERIEALENLISFASNAEFEIGTVKENDNQ